MLRIGNFPGDDRPHSERAGHIWISERDMLQLVTCCIEADDGTELLEQAKEAGWKVRQDETAFQGGQEQ